MHKRFVPLLIAVIGSIPPRAGAEPPPPPPLPAKAAPPAPPASTGKDAKDARELLRQGLFEEEANRDQTKAAAAYAGVVEQYDAQRNYIATAMFRLAEIRVKQGNKAEGTALYQRLLKEFFDNEPLVKLSGERLAALGTPAPSTHAADVVNEEIARKEEIDRKEREQDIFRQAEQLVRAGQTEQAKALYLELLRFPENDPLVKLGYGRLAAFGPIPPPAAATPAPDAPTKEEAEELARVRELVKNSPDLLNAVKVNTTPLSNAALSGWNKVAAYLLDHGAKVNGINNDGIPLHAAAATGNKSIVEMLLAHGADINAATPDGFTALHAACIERREEVIRLLLEKGANPNTVYRYTKKRPDTQVGWGPKSQDMMSEKEPQGPDDLPGTPLLTAMRNGDLGLMTQLLDHGADPNLDADAWMPDRKSSPLIRALTKGNAAAAELLMKRGTKVDFVDSEGFSALHAAAVGAPSFVPMLLERGLAQTPAGSRAYDGFTGKTPLACSLVSPGLWSGVANAPTSFEQRFAEYRRAWEAMLARGADLNAPDAVEGKTPMHEIVRHLASPDGQTVAAWLLEHGVNINALDKAGDTPLLDFCRSHKSSILNAESKQALAWLLDHGADPSLKNLRGEDALALLPGDARFQLNRDLLYPRLLPKLTKERAVTALINYKDLSTRGPEQIKALADYDAPPTMIQLIQRALSIYSLRENMGIRVYRATDAGPAVEVARLMTRYGRQSLDASQPAPALRWGDAVVFESEDQDGQGISPGSAYDWIQEILTAQGRNVGVLYGDHHLTTFRQAEPLLIEKPVSARSGGNSARKAPPFGWSPWLPTLPSWTLSELVLHLTEADPRARLDAIQIRRVVNAKTGETQTWTADLRWTAAADGSNAKDAEPGADGRPSKIKKSAVRLGEGDVLIIPQRPAGDAEALAARREIIGIATPGKDVNATGREFSVPVFDRRRNELGGHTLGEAIMQAYLSQMVVPNPDLSRIVIHRLKGDGGEEEHLPIDLMSAMRRWQQEDTSSDNARKSDIPLQWGDIVEIVPLPNADPAKWKGFGAETQSYFTNALQRNVSYTLNGTAVSSNLIPVFSSFAYYPAFPGANYPGYGVADQPLGVKGPFSLRTLFDRDQIDASSIVRVTLRQGEQKREYDGAAAELNPWIGFDTKLEIQQFSP